MNTKIALKTVLWLAVMVAIPLGGYYLSSLIIPKPGSLAARFLDQQSPTSEVETIVPPQFFDEVSVLDGNYSAHPLIADFYARTAEIGLYKLNSVLQYRNHVLVEISLPTECYEIYVYEYQSTGWTFVEIYREYCSQT